jgi:hypothetical protein
MTVDLKKAIANAEDIDAEIVDVEQWGVKLQVRGMSAGARSRFLQSFTDEDGNIDYEKMYPHLLIATVFDPDSGTPVFDANDVDLINEKSASAVETVAKVSQRLSGMTKESDDEVGKDS